MTSYTVEQISNGEGLSRERSVIAFTYDGEEWFTCDLSESLRGEPVEVYTVPPKSRGGWEARA